MGGGKGHPEKEGAPGQKSTSEEELDIWERKGATAGGSEPPGKRRGLPIPLIPRFSLLCTLRTTEHGKVAVCRASGCLQSVCIKCSALFQEFENVLV
ncbi:hypothetical protein J1605_009974 [Eschrichtius robustus]|uniref:Uncharacterized protein n=1 Tax=Eschrichtius robustus TaxID=9764 RepID=A0AB34GW00_ESCRO|nr:hypothetical protein J1605_009974 [Eschrichtius robustus]